MNAEKWVKEIDEPTRQEAEAIRFAGAPLAPCPSSCGICHPNEVTRRAERRQKGLDNARNLR